MSEKPSFYIFCPHDVSWSKVEKTWVNNSVGANQHVNMCLAKGCWCERLEAKMDELYGKGGQDNG
jgi:hypothetical protein